MVAVLFSSYVLGVIHLATELTPVSKIATLVLTVIVGVALLNMFIRDFREKKSLRKQPIGPELTPVRSCVS